MRRGARIALGVPAALLVCALSRIGTKRFRGGKKTLAFVDDGRRLVTCTFDGFVRTIDRATDATALEFPAQAGCWRQAREFPVLARRPARRRVRADGRRPRLRDRRRLATASEDGTVLVRDVAAALTTSRGRGCAGRSGRSRASLP